MRATVDGGTPILIKLKWFSRDWWRACSGYCYQDDAIEARGLGYTWEQASRCMHDLRPLYWDEPHASPQACSRCNPLQCVCLCHRIGYYARKASK